MEPDITDPRRITCCPPYLRPESSSSRSTNQNSPSNVDEHRRITIFPPHRTASPRIVQPGSQTRKLKRKGPLPSTSTGLVSIVTYESVWESVYFRLMKVDMSGHGYLCWTNNDQFSIVMIKQVKNYQFDSQRGNAPSLQHPNIAEVVELFRADNLLYSMYVPASVTLAHIVASPGPVLKEFEIAAIVTEVRLPSRKSRKFNGEQVLNGLEAIHTHLLRGYGFLKIDSILLSNDGGVKLGTPLA